MWNVLGEDLRDDLEVDLVVGVDQTAAQADPARPGNLRVSSLDFGRHASRGLAEDLEQSDESEAADPVLFQPAPVQTFSQGQRLARWSSICSMAIRGSRCDILRLRFGEHT